MLLLNAITIQSFNQLLGVAVVVVDPGMAFIQTHRLDNHVFDAQSNEFAVQSVAEGASLVATVHGLSQRKLGFDPLAKLAPGQPLGRLGCAMVEYPYHDDGVGVNVQFQLIV